VAPADKVLSSLEIGFVGWLYKYRESYVKC
jgi:hypothetical protein